MVGGTTSRTLTWKAQYDVRPALSVVLHATIVVVAVVNWLPEAKEQIVAAIPDPSAATGANKTDAYSCPLSGLAVMLAGQEMVGTVVSTMATKKVQVAEAPALLKAVQETELFVFKSNVVPAAGLQLNEAIPTVSVAEARNVLTLARG
jgi:hypothetical protein